LALEHAGNDLSAVHREVLLEACHADAKRKRARPVSLLLDRAPAGCERKPVIGQILLDRFTVQAELGEGGMGVIYRATDERGQPVAIKRLHASVATSAELTARFQREAAAQAMLSHPNIAALHAVGVTDDGGMFFVMELIDGHDLATELEHGPLVPARALALTRQLLSGLHHAHQFGLVHRDLKPENVLLARTPGGEQAKIIDFGLVKMLDDVLGPSECQRLTRTGMIFGTPDYMSPEQILAEPVDARTDLYAVGILLFELLTGQRPFEFEEVTDLWRAHIGKQPPSLASINPRLGGYPDLEAIVQTLLAKRPDERFGSALAARRALESVAV
jgi:serine/threonine protein kinase